MHFIDENDLTWEAHSSWGGSFNDDGPTIDISPDRARYPLGCTQRDRYVADVGPTWMYRR